MIVALVWHLYGFIQSCFLEFPIKYLDGQEFFITYSGGFVRRGLSGELLMLLTKFTGISPITIIKVVVITFYAVFTAWLWLKCRRAGWSWWLCLSPLACGLTAYIIRKDYLQLTLLIPILTLCRVDGLGTVRGLIITILILIELLVHEAFFFWGAPIPMLVLLTSSRSKLVGATCCLAVIVVQAALCINHGSQQVTDIIIGSWQGLFKEADQLIGSGLSGLNWDAVTTFKNHIHMNFQGSSHQGGLGWGVSLVRLCIFLINAFVGTQFVGTFSRSASTKEGNISAMMMTRVYLLISICMIPMFTILSCDYGRLYQYVTVTSMMSCLILSHKTLNLATGWFLPNVIRRIETYISDISLSRRQWFVGTLLLVAGDSPWGFDVDRWFSSTIIGAVYNLCTGSF